MFYNLALLRRLRVMGAAVLGLLSGCIPSHPLLKSGPVDLPAAAARIPFTESFGAIVVDAEVNGVAARLVFDTGAGATVLSQDFAGRLGLTTEFLTRTRDANKQEGDLYLGRVSTLRVGDLVHHDHPVLVVPMDGGRWDCVGVDGILGAVSMRAASWSVDFDARQLTCWPDAPPPAEFGGHSTIPMHTDRLGVPHVDASIAGRDLRFLVDLGSNFGIDLDEEARRGLPADQLRPVATGAGASFAVFGVHDTGFELAEVARVELGGVALDWPLVRVKEDVSCKLGLGVFRRHHLVLDWHTRRIHLGSRATPPEPWSFAQVGLAPDGDGVVVSSLAAVDPDLGLQLGDRVITVDGVALDELDADERCRLLQELASECDRVVNVGYRRGDGPPEERSVRLRVCWEGGGL